jgi:hypothetical protein
MESAFETVITRMAKEQGAEAFLDTARCKNFLADYSGAAFKNERLLLLKILEDGCAQEIIRAHDLAAAKFKLIRRMREELFLDEGPAAELIDLLGLVLRGDRTKTRPEPAPLSVNLASIPGGASLLNGFPPVTAAQEILDGLKYRMGKPWGDVFAEAPVTAVYRPGKGRFRADEYIWTKWAGDGNFYFARIIQTTDQYVKVVYYDGTVEEIKKADAFYLAEALALGAYTLMGDYKYRNGFYRCEILELRKNTAVVVYSEDGVREELLYRGLIFWKF